MIEIKRNRYCKCQKSLNWMTFYLKVEYEYELHIIVQF